MDYANYMDCCLIYGISIYFLLWIFGGIYGREIMKVSIIMSFSDRLRNLHNTLLSWSKITYPDVEFVLTDNGSKYIDEAMSLVLDFKESTNHNVTFYRNDTYVHVNKVWNKSAKELSDGEYVVFAMMDEIVKPYVIQDMLDASRASRCSVNTYFLDEITSATLEDISWWENTKYIESLPGFWDYEYKGSTNRDKVDASLLSHVTGWSREQWEWFGWFRNNDRGHLWLDQDIVISERALGLTAQTVSSCYHQFHEEKIDPLWLAPGYHPINERQARLLEESERDAS